jgi:excisionase family DNA binding protein
MQSEITPRALRTKPAADYVGISPWKLRKKAQDGLIPYIDDGGPWRFDRLDLDRYIEANKHSEMDID